MAIRISDFGTHKGTAVGQFHLVSETGAEVDILGYGLVVRDWRVPAPEGLRSVVLGFDDLPSYLEHSPHFGGIAGRVANRIAHASFALGDQSYALPVNESDYCLHGGPEGLGRLVWQGEADSAGNAVRFTHRSPDGAMGFPGNVEFEAVYSLKGNRLRLEFLAIPDRPTPISLVQHQYFNLSRDETVIDHHFQFDAAAFTEVDANLIPTGTIRRVEGSKWDFQQPRTLRDGAGHPVSFDGNLVLRTARDFAQPIATVRAPHDDLTLRLWSDRPGLQFYNGIYTNVPVPGLNGRSYKQYSGFCLEDQMWPDALHQPHFPSIIVTPDQPYRHWCEFEIA